MDKNDDGVQAHSVPSMRWGSATSKKMPTRPTRTGPGQHQERQHAHRKAPRARREFDPQASGLRDFGAEAGLEHALETFETSGFRRMVSKHLGWERNAPGVLVVLTCRDRRAAEILWLSRVRRPERGCVQHFWTDGGFSRERLLRQHQHRRSVMVSAWVTFVNSALRSF